MNNKKYLLHFPKSPVDQTVLSELIRDYGLAINIYRARINPDEEGYMVIDISGDEKNIKKGVIFLKERGVSVNDQQEGLVWEKETCVGCGNCLTHCPTKTLHIKDRKTMEVEFDVNKCIECLNCIKVCPYGAIKSIF